MIVDCFMFGLEYECDLLELRLEYLDSIVDKFVLVEAKFTQLGDPKELFYEKHKERYAKWNDKIVHIALEEPVSKEYYTWENENYQRNAIVQGLNKLNLNPNDVIIISDLDEIPSYEGIRYFIDNNCPSPAGMTQEMYYYYLNMKANYTWDGIQIARYELFMNGVMPQQLRNARVFGYRIPVHGGWHFSYLGGKKAVLQKITSVCESNYHLEYQDEKILEEYINSDVLHFNKEPLHKVEVMNENLPFNFKERYNELLEKGLMK